MIRFLIGTFKVLAWSIAGIVLALLLAFLYYDVTEFQPRKDDIAGLIESAHASERSPPAELRQLLLIEHRGDLSLLTARLLLFNLDLPRGWRRGLSWQTHNLLWWQLVRLHLSVDEQFAIVCSKSFFGRRSDGFEAGAHAYFERPLVLLTDKELAMLVVINRWPSRFSRPEHLADLVAARDALLERAPSAAPLRLD